MPKTTFEYPCTLCGAPFASVDTRTKHSATCSGAPPDDMRACRCGRRVIGLSSFNTHVRQCDVPRPDHSCARCGRPFRSPGDLRGHQSTCDGVKVKVNKCKDCGVPVRRAGQHTCSLVCVDCPVVRFRTEKDQLVHIAHCAEFKASVARSAVPIADRQPDDLNEVQALARSVLPNPPSALLIKREPDEKSYAYLLRIANGLHLYLLMVGQILGIPDLDALIETAVYGPFPCPHPFLMEVRQILFACFVHLNVGPGSVNAFDNFSTTWWKATDEARTDGRLKPLSQRSARVNDFLQGAYGSAGRGHASEQSNPLADPNSPIRQIIRFLLHLYGMSFDELYKAVCTNFTVAGRGSDRITGPGRLLASFTAYIMNVTTAAGLGYVRAALAEMVQAPRAPGVQVNKLSISARDFVADQPVGMLAKQMLFAAAKELGVSSEDAHAAYAFGAHIDDFPQLPELRRLWFKMFVDVCGFVWTHTRSVAGFVTLCSHAWDEQRAIGAHARGRWTVEEFEQIEQLLPDHSLGFISQEMGRSYASVRMASSGLKKHGIRITKSGQKDKARLEGSKSASSKSKGKRKRASSPSSSEAEFSVDSDDETEFTANSDDESEFDVELLATSASSTRGSTSSASASSTSSASASSASTSASASTLASSSASASSFSTSSASGISKKSHKKAKMSPPSVSAHEASIVSTASAASTGAKDVIDLTLGAFGSEDVIDLTTE